MATVVFKRQDLYPVGTVVNAYSLPVPRPGGLFDRNSGNPENWKAPLTKVATATVDSEGKLTYTVGSGAGEMPTGKPILLWAEVSSKDVFLQVRAPETAREPI